MPGGFRTVGAEVIDEVSRACTERGFIVELVDSGAEALDRLIALIPPGADMTTGSSVTLEQIGFLALLDRREHTWRYRRHEILQDPSEQRRLVLRRQATTADYVVGSVNALAGTGEAVITDAGGTRVAAYVYGAANVIWVVGTNKLVPTLDDAIARVRKYVVPLEDERLRAAGGAGTWVGRTLLFEREHIPGRTRLLLVDEPLGY